MTPARTRRSLLAGAFNACHDGIVAECISGCVLWRVCEDEDACTRPWQKAGGYRCSEGADTPPVTFDAGSVAPGIDAGTTSTVVSNLQNVVSLAVAGADLYCCADAAVWTVAKTGGAPRALGEVLGGCGAGMAVDESDVFVRSAPPGSRVVRVARAGGQASAILEDTSNVLSFAVDATSVVWVDATDLVIRRLAKNLVGGEKLVGPANGYVRAALQIFDGRVYWADDKGLASRPVSGDPEASPGKVGLLASALDFRLGFGVAYSLSAPGALLRTGLTSGESLRLTSTAPDPYAVAASTEDVFWSDAVGIHQLRNDGGSAVLVASESTSLLVADDDGLYWYAGGRIERRGTSR